jgi:Protein of unknown function (DUF3455)
MKNCNALKNQTRSRILLVAGATALAVAFTVSVSQPAYADHVTPPPVPADLRVEEGNIPFLEGHAVGTQNYTCLPCPNATTTAAMCPDASGFAWILFTPQATLFRDNGKEVMTHYFSPNPDEGGTIRATWQNSHDTSRVWGGRAISSTDPDFVALGAIPWVLLPKAGVQGGPLGSDTLTATTFIQRLNTSGGVAPPTGCSSSADVGARAFVPYTADYFFYKAASPTNVAQAAEKNTNGAAGQMPAYYDGELFTVNMKEMPNSDPLLGHNSSVNEIYASNDLDEEQDFIPVIDAIQGEGFNPLWQQILIVFNEGFTPHQFFSEEEIQEAAAGDNPEITLVETDEVYRCSVVGGQ